MKIEVYSDMKFSKFELRNRGGRQVIATGLGVDMPLAMELQRRVNNYDELVNALRDIMSTPSRAAVIAAQALYAAKEG
jgi:hypothetical protein